MIRTIIVENESSTSDILVSRLKELYPDVEVVEICKTVETSLTAIREFSPELIFLDIELDNNESGFDILKRLDIINFEVIITTSFDRYAVQACKASAIDILLKPYLKEELIEAVEKYIKRKGHILDPRQLELLNTIIKSSSLFLRKIALPTLQGYEYKKTDEIIYFEGAGSQAKVFYIDGRTDIVTRTLKYLTELLLQSNFQRIHKSYLVNLYHVKKFLRSGKDGLIEINGISETLPVSRDYKEEFLNRSGIR